MPLFSPVHFAFSSRYRFENDRRKRCTRIQDVLWFYYRPLNQKTLSREPWRPAFFGGKRRKGKKTIGVTPGADRLRRAAYFASIANVIGSYLGGLACEVTGKAFLIWPGGLMRETTAFMVPISYHLFRQEPYLHRGFWGAEGARFLETRVSLEFVT